MKNFGLTVLMMLFIGVGTSMAQDKKVSDADASNTVKIEKVAKDHACEPGCAKACCAKAGAKADAAGKKACAPGCEKKCTHASAATKEDAHEGHDHAEPKK